MRDIIDGFSRFQRDAYPVHSQLFKSLATWQAPRVLFIAYSDSRVVLELLIQCESGKLSMIRSTSNIVPGYGPQLGGVNTSTEYAVVVLGVGDIVVRGHSDYGVMGAIASRACLDQLPAVVGWLHNVEAARAMSNAHEHVSKATQLDALIWHNVTAQLTNLRTHPYVARVLEQGRLNLYG